MVSPETYSVEYVHTDALGSPVSYTSSTGSVLPYRNTRYEPYGTPTTTPRDGEPTYTGHQYDTGTGLIYAQARYYDPALGRFLGPDPMAVDTSSGFNWNRYAYANNSPYKFTDPDGRMSKEMADEANRQAENERNKSPVDRIIDKATEMFDNSVSDGQAVFSAAANGEPLPAMATIGLAMNFTPAGPEGSATAKLGFQIVEREGNVIIGLFKGAAGEGRVITEMSLVGDTLLLSGTHIEGKGTLKEALQVAKQFGKDQGAKKVVIEPGKRTTGANPGHTPRKIEIDTE